MRKLNKIPVLTGRMPLLYTPSAFVDAINLLNAHSNIINYLAEVIEAQEKEIGILKEMVEGKKNEDIYE